MPRLIAPLLLLMTACAGAPAGPKPPEDAMPRTLRVATFNASLNRPTAGALRAQVAQPGDPQLAAVAEIIQRNAPDVLVLQEVDYDATGETLRLFAENYLAVSQNGAPPIKLPYVLAPPSNTGVPTGLDLDHDGKTDGPADAQGFGLFPGQYGFAVLSRYPIDEAAARTFGKLLWRDLPGAKLPVDPATGAPWYAPEALAVLRLSSKNHLAAPVQVGGRTIWIVVAHPTPPVFDGPEDRNGRRNHDEIRLLADLIDPARGAALTDDQGRKGRLPADADFVICGDLNADPVDGDSVDAAVAQVLDHPRVHPETARGALVPRSAGGQANPTEGPHQGDPAQQTAHWGLRVDYVLPSRTLKPVASAVFWPTADDPLARLVATTTDAQGRTQHQSSDHRLVYVDLEL
ncbi:MAG: endonuclease/exonuclease/phosphatase family protein [Myxococcales bacterium]|nr:endonuclease/exonuclease/phosphatase family protein [Myxococcales bacterium]